MTKLEKLQEKHAKEIALLEKTEAIFNSLPDIKMPLIVHNGGEYFGTNGTMIFKGSKEELTEIVKAIESEWNIVAPSVVKYGNWRISEFPSLSPPIKRGNSELKSHREIYPAFLNLSAGNGYSSQRIEFYAENPAGEVYSIKLDVKTSFYVRAQISEYKGGWTYNRGTASVDGGEKSIESEKHAYVNTEQSIAGTVYFPTSLRMPVSELIELIIR